MLALRRIGVGILGLGALSITVVGIAIETGNMLEGGRSDAYVGAGMIVFFLAITLAALHALKGQPRRPLLSIVGAGITGLGIAAVGNFADSARAGELADPVGGVGAILLFFAIGAPLFYFSALPKPAGPGPIDPAALDRRSW